MSDAFPIIFISLGAIYYSLLHFFPNSRLSKFLKRRGAKGASPYDMVFVILIIIVTILMLSLDLLKYFSNMFGLYVSLVIAFQLGKYAAKLESKEE